MCNIYHSFIHFMHKNKYSNNDVGLPKYKLFRSIYIIIVFFILFSLFNPD